MEMTATIFTFCLTVLSASLVPTEGGSLPLLDQDLKTFTFDQTLDHFSYLPSSGYARFPQKYTVVFKYWRGANEAAPIFVYLGGGIPPKWNPTTGFLTDNAPLFGALLVFIEHRYYGDSLPFPREEALSNASTMGYLNSAQALADYAQLITALKHNLSAQSSPVVVVGASYGGMLAAWFRLKYPHIAFAALASSAPILYFDNMTTSNGFYSVVTKDYKDASQTCYRTILTSWPLIAQVSGELELLALSKTFKTCRPLQSSTQLKNYLVSVYVRAAQYNMPPIYPVKVMCDGIDGGFLGTDILGRILSGLEALSQVFPELLPFDPIASCFDVSGAPAPAMSEWETTLQWQWQTCTEIVMPIGSSDETPFIPDGPFDLKVYSELCNKNYGVFPRADWITTYYGYGGHSVDMVLKNFASNIIFSNGLRDPYSCAGVLGNISDSIVAIYTAEGSHGLDLHAKKEDDPNWLVNQRNTEIQLLQQWLSQSGN